MHEKITIELLNGEEVELLLNFQKLSLLKKVRNDLYQKYNSLMINQKYELEFLDMPFILYIAYWCANYNVGKKIYTDEEFVELVPFDFKLIRSLMNRLINPKKNKNSEIHSSKEQEK